MTTWTLDDYTIPLQVFSFIFNILLTILILRLRYQNEHSPLTQSQRWGLTLLGYLYLSNSMLILCVIFLYIYPSTTDPLLNRTIGWFTDDFNMLASMFLLMFGLVYPRPVIRWERMRFVFALIAIIWTITLILQDAVIKHAGVTIFGSGFRLISPFYDLAIFVPIFLWLPQYERQSSPEMRMVLSFMIWGYLLYFSTTTLGGLAAGIQMSHYASDETIWVSVLIVITFLYLARVLYMRLGRWTAAEKTNLFFIILSIIISTGYYSLNIYTPSNVNYIHDPLMGQVTFLITSGTWMIGRSTLFLIGLIRYQFFGPSVKAGEAFTILLGLLASCGVFLLLFFNLMVLDVGLAIIGGLIVAVMVFWSTRGLLGKMVSRLLPMMSGSKTASLSERRTTYMVGLQSAVIAGEVSDPYDAEVLKRLRKDLRVSDREHDLLMSGLSKEKPPSEKQEVEEVYLFHKGGTLLGYVLRHEKGAHDGKKDMMVTMFTAVREFSADALKRGSDHLGAIDYGSTVLIVELEGDIALGVVLRGRDNPQVRQQMRDLLRKVQAKYSEPIKATIKGPVKDLGTVRSSFDGLEDMLRGFLKA